MRVATTTAGRLIASFFGLPSMPRTRRASTFLKPYRTDINRHTGQPHEHKREIARHLRQAKPA